jgi:hypothetical protein
MKGGQVGASKFLLNAHLHIQENTMNLRPVALCALCFVGGCVVEPPPHRHPPREVIVEQPVQREYVEEVIAPQPPPERIVEVEPGPRAGYVWARGYWHWNGRAYVAAPGHWEVVRPGYHYVHPHWEQGHGGWHFRAGVWVAG